MAKPVVGLITFGGSAGPLQTGWLDTNNNTLTAALNDLQTYGNYLIDSSGVVNSISVATAANLTATFSAGLPLQIKVANTNTGPVTIALNANPATPLINPDGSALSAGQIRANGVYPVQYDGTNFYLQTGTAISATNSVKSYGAIGNGVADDTAAFSSAGTNVPAAVNTFGPFTPGVAFAPRNRVIVPPGTYNITSQVNTNGNDTEWILDDAANIPNTQFLTGTLVREGRRNNRVGLFGIGDYTCGLSITANGNLDAAPQVMGFTAPTQLANYPTRDSVGVFSATIGPLPLANIAGAGTTYTATTIVPGVALTAAQVAQMRVGMIINTQHASPFTGWVTSWAANGTSITVAAWYNVGGGGTTGTPANAFGAYVNPITKIWSFNSTVNLPASSLLVAATGYELDCLNNLSQPGGIGLNPRVWGFDIVNTGTFDTEFGYLSRGSWYAHFCAGTGASTFPNVNNNSTGTFYGFLANVAAGANITANAIGFISGLAISGGQTCAVVRGYQMSDTLLQNGSLITTQSGFFCADLTHGTNNRAFESNVSAGPNKRAFFGGGTADSQFGGSLGLFGNTPPAQLTGFGTPVGNAVVANYNITDAGGANSNTNKVVAQCVATFKALGLWAA